MYINEALSILGLSNQDSTITPSDIKTAYCQAAQKYHPEHNPAGLEMMQLINQAFDIAKNYTGNAQPTSRHYGDAINAALNAIIHLGLKLEICGCWVWVSGDTRSHKEALKAAGYLWAPKKQLWYFRPSTHKSRNRGSWTIDKIREAYGSDSIHRRTHQIATV